MDRSEDLPQELRDKYINILHTLAGLTEAGLKSYGLDASGILLVIVLPDGREAMTIGAGSPSAIAATLQRIMERFTERSMEENRQN